MLRLLLVVVLVNGLVTFPHWILSGFEDIVVVSLEALTIVGILGLVPRGVLARRLSYGVAVFTVLLLVLAVADAILQIALGRLLNLYLDVFLLRPVYELLVGNIGGVATGMVLVLLPIGIGFCTLLLGNLINPNRASRKRGLVKVVCLAFAVFGGSGIYGLELPVPQERIATPLIRVGIQQTQHFFRMLKERERFTAEIKDNQEREETRRLNLNKLKGTNVFLAFVESYGMSVISDDRFQSVMGPRMIDFERRMERADIGVVSGSLVAPSQGGQSWYGHAAILSGLWVDNQLRYDLLLAEKPETLIDDFKNIGHKTIALMPAITRSWPEGQRFGYDQIFTHENIDYAGPPLNWVTMPDQFTWSFLQNNIRQGSDGAPLFVELGLISSHAPWTPILEVYDDWNSIADGKIFMEWGDTGPTPKELWMDNDEVKKHYGLSVDYAINAMTGFAEQYIKEKDLLIVLGDHQAAPLITGDDASKAVPVHVISKNQNLLEPFLEWGFIPGVVPKNTADVPGMDSFRGMLLEAYSDSILSLQEGR